ncbi:uncharacterized protein CYBJADRAFT_168548 [Cyberlindnera jadinii NRRL Y-1542]|uniref:Uncharacterized protein n=1 Tax=Cyberlindnera jadinii (strain ATCC 18201 / CBS 1600 / BCRC 20928 / JCM 3617 / NBRC 0987 / NRRL Y-1542) TaxID=983966 RepID=A0A1E4RZG2_CYBJN|nr:hypothetical protein CYBJADRAFT_168548 [Cyberlindnera jadinii NRRL Y-1542]ODV72639.1 hypothetical protein CYBJADRAFT_168548 [Cyberlindnera jadinii NRRL Y-1542]
MADQMCINVYQYALKWLFMAVCGLFSPFGGDAAARTRNDRSLYTGWGCLLPNWAI